jgi:hypothetical protein
MTDAKPGEKYTHYNPVRVSDTVGALALALIALLLLAALLRSQARNRALLERLAQP